ncbi:MAG: hypothetical protein D6707_12815, partial [Bacteroidetes bacterium]
IEQPSLVESIENATNNTEETNIENAAEESTSVSETTEITANEETIAEEQIVAEELMIEEQNVTEEPINEEKTVAENITGENISSEKQLSAQSPGEINQFYTQKIQEAKKQELTEEEQLNLYQEWENTIKQSIDLKKEALASAGSPEQHQQLQSEIDILNLQLENVQQQKALIQPEELAQTTEETTNEESLPSEQPPITESANEQRTTTEEFTRNTTESSEEKIIAENTGEQSLEKSLAETENTNSIPSQKESPIASINPQFINEDELLSKTYDDKIENKIYEIETLEEQITNLNAEISGTKKKKDKEILQAQVISLQKELEIKRKELSYLQEEQEALEKSEQALIHEKQPVDELAEKYQAEASVLYAETAKLSSKADSLRQAANNTKKKKKRMEMLKEAETIEQLVAEKETEAKHKENLAKSLLSSQETILAMAAKPPALPEINKPLSAEEVKEVEQSPVYQEYNNQVTESKKLYAQAEVYYRQVTEMESQIAQTESEIARLNEEISQTSDEEIRKEKQTQIEIKQQELQKLSQQKDSLKTLADNTQKQAEEKERQAIDYLFAQEKNVYENILAYENLKEKGELPTETTALAEETASVEEENSLASVNLEEFSIESEVIDKVPEKVEKEIFIKAPEPKPVYTRERPIPIVNKLPEGLVFKVQVGAFRNPISPEIFKGFAPITGEKTESGLTRYTAGYFKSLNSANEAKNEIRALGYSDAFVVAYYNGERIPIYKARQLMESSAATQPELAENNTPSPVIAEEKTFENTAAVSQPVHTNSNAIVNQPVTVNNNNAGGAAVSTDVSKLKGLFFTVQVGVYSKPVPASKLYNISPLNSEVTENGYIRYSSGIYTDINQATAAKNKIVDIGISDAFVTAYFNGKRISIAEAKKLLAENGSSILVKPGQTAAPENSPTVPNQNASNASSSKTYKVIIAEYAQEVPVSDAAALLQISSEDGIEKEKKNGISVYFKTFNNPQQAQDFYQKVINLGFNNAKITE